VKAEEGESGEKKKGKKGILAKKIVATSRGWGVRSRHEKPTAKGSNEGG